MDKITEAQLDEFSNENALEALPQNARFEHYVSYVTVQNLYGETFDTGDIVLGGDEFGLDGIAIIVNGALIPDLDSFNAIADITTSLDVAFNLFRRIGHTPSIHPKSGISFLLFAIFLRISRNSRAHHG